ncbi:MAG: hypothetical protein ACI4PC_02630 [Oscillospiraceae bacterium]
MKKLVCALLALTLVFSLAACGSSASSGENSQTYPGDGMSVTEIKDKVLEGLEDLPMLGDIEPDAESFEYYTFVPYQEGVECIVSEAMISAIAHSMVILRAPDAETAQTLAQEIETNANPAKWICVEAEKTIVSVHGSTILLVMSSEKNADAIAANFDALWK